MAFKICCQIYCEKLLPAYTFNIFYSVGFHHLLVEEDSDSCWGFSAL